LTPSDERGGAFGIAAPEVFWDGQAQLFVLEGGIGVVISLILLVSAISFAETFSWCPKLAQTRKWQRLQKVRRELRFARNRCASFAARRKFYMETQ